MSDVATDVVEVKVPDIGDFEDVPVIEVHVAPGDTIALEDPLVTLESDKATMDVPSPVEGVVQELKVGIGDSVSEGSVILVAAAGGVDGAAAAELLAEPAAEDAEAVADEIAAATPPPAATAPAERDGGGVLYAGPGARRLARELGVDLATVRGTGRKGRILKTDVEAASKGQGAPAAAATPSKGAAVGGLEVLPWPKVDFEKFGEVERVALSRIKRISGPVLHRNWVSIPHVTHNDEADITELEAFRKRTNDEIAKSGVKLTMVALLLKACVPALQRFPELNSSLEGDELVLKRYYHLGFAADTPQGLVVPVIRDVDSKGLVDIASRAHRAVGQGARGQARPVGHGRRHVHHLLPRRPGRHELHADHQRARGRDPRRHALGDQGGVGRQPVRARASWSRCRSPTTTA